MAKKHQHIKQGKSKKYGVLHRHAYLLINISIHWKLTEVIHIFLQRIIIVRENMTEKGRESDC